MTRYAAHPTYYKGILFRSRLEAKWAVYFDQRGWRWQYEPLDLQGYTPDFMVEGVLTEVKPATKVGQLSSPASRLMKTWRGPWRVVGADPDVCMEGTGRHVTGRRQLGTEAPDAWAVACNLTQWFPTKDDRLPTCPKCGRQDHLLHKRICSDK